jgi:hypothetical protein
METVCIYFLFQFIKVKKKRKKVSQEINKKKHGNE